MKAIIEAFEEELERVLNIDDEYGDGFELEVPDAVAILTALKAGQAYADAEQAFRDAATATAYWKADVARVEAKAALRAAYEVTP